MNRTCERKRNNVSEVEKGKKAWENMELHFQTLLSKATYKEKQSTIHKVD